MPAISKEQFFSMIYGVLSTAYNQQSSELNPTQPRTKFTPVSGKTILAIGRENLATVTNLSTADNYVIIAGLNPSNISVGMPINKVAGAGALNATQGYIGTITSVDATNSPIGTPLVNTRLTVVNSSGTALNNATAGALTKFTVGGIDLTNNQIPGLGDPSREVFTIGVGNPGGDMDANGSVSNLEKDFHLTGIGIRKKVK